MNIYTSVPRVGDRIAVLLGHASNNWVSFTGSMGSRTWQAMGSGGLHLVEGKIGAVSPWQGSRRNPDSSVIGGLTVYVPNLSGTEVSYVNLNVEGYGITYALNNLRRVPAFHRYGDDDTLLLFRLCFGQPFASDEYVRMIRDIRGDDALPPSVATTRQQAVDVAERLDIPFIPFEGIENVFTTTTLACETIDDSVQVQAALEEFYANPTSGRTTTAQTQTQTWVEVSPSLDWTRSGAQYIDAPSEAQQVDSAGESF